MSKNLTAEVLPISNLTEEYIHNMYVLFNEYYEANFDIFQRDLSAKNWVLLLKDTQSGYIQGFSTLAFYKSTLHGDEFGVVYSGDTIIRPAYWGSSELPRTWIKAVLEIGESLPKPLYWLLISSGYKTYRFLTVFFKDFYPRYNRSIPPETQLLIHHLAQERFGTSYCPQLGIVRFQRGATPLRAGVADITDRRLKDPHVAYFVKKNPGHAEGDELVCITHIHLNNLTSAGKRMLL